MTTLKGTGGVLRRPLRLGVGSCHRPLDVVIPHCLSRSLVKHWCLYLSTSEDGVEGPTKAETLDGTSRADVRRGWSEEGFELDGAGGGEGGGGVYESEEGYEEEEGEEG